MAPVFGPAKCPRVVLGAPSAAAMAPSIVSQWLHGKNGSNEVLADPLLHATAASPSQDVASAPDAVVLGGGTCASSTAPVHHRAAPLLQHRPLGGTGARAHSAMRGDALEARLALCASLVGPPLPPSVDDLAGRLAHLSDSETYLRCVSVMGLLLRGRDGCSVHLLGGEVTDESQPPDHERMPRRTALLDGAVPGTGVIAQALQDGCLHVLSRTEMHDFATVENNRRLAEWLALDMMREDLALLPVAARGAVLPAAAQPVGLLLAVLPAVQMAQPDEADILSLAAVAQHLSLALSLMPNPEDDPGVDTLRPPARAPRPQLSEAFVDRLADASFVDLAAAARGDLVATATAAPRRAAPAFPGHTGSSS